MKFLLGLFTGLTAGVVIGLRLVYGSAPSEAVAWRESDDGIQPTDPRTLVQ